MKSENLFNEEYGQVSDLEQKLHDTIIRYKGIPYYTLVDGTNLCLRSLDNANGKIVHSVNYRDPDIDISTVPLGYVNLDPYKAAIYIKRLPVRRVKQGINAHNTHVEFALGTTRQILDHYGRNGLLYNKEFENSILGKFPPLPEALNRLRELYQESEIETNTPIAISRDVGLSMDEQGIIKVFYQEGYVGWMPPNENTVMVGSKNNLGWVVSKYLNPYIGWNVL